MIFPGEDIVCGSKLFVQVSVERIDALENSKSIVSNFHITGGR